MQTAATESSWPVMGAIKWTRTYYAMTATPLTERDVLIGHQLFVVTRVLTASAGYLLVVAAFGAVNSWLGLLAIPVAVLIGTAFSMPIAAYAATTRERGDLPADLPLRDRADVPLLRDVLPGLADAARARARRVRDADLARRRALPRADARHDRAAARARPPRLPARVDGRRARRSRAAPTGGGSSSEHARRTRARPSRRPRRCCSSSAT